DHRLRGRRDRRHRLDHRRARRIAAGRLGGHLRQGVLHRVLGHRRLPAEGHHPGLAARGAAVGEARMSGVAADVKASIVPLLAALALALLPALLTPYQSDLVLKVMVFSVFALSLELLVGMTGLVSLGHGALFG